MNELTKASIRSVADLQRAARRASHVLTLFSGGLDSTWLLSLLAPTGVRITALTVDVGDAPDFVRARRHAEHFGAELVVVDARERFVAEAVLPAVRAHACYLGVYPLSASLSRPVMAAVAVEQAAVRRCDALAHSACASQNSLRRLDGAFAALGYPGAFGSPCASDAVSRAEKVRVLERDGLSGFAERRLSADSNLWCREFEAGALDDPARIDVPRDAWSWTVDVDTEGPEDVRIGFESGLPVALDGRRMPAVALVDELNLRAGTRGVGRYEGFEYLGDDTRVLEVREAPAACVLLAALRHLEMATLPSALLREKLAVEQLWVAEALEGRWFGTVRATADDFIANAVRGLDGEVCMRLGHGQVRLVGMDAARPAYLTDRDAWERRRAQRTAVQGAVEGAVEGAAQGVVEGAA